MKSCVIVLSFVLLLASCNGQHDEASVAGAEDAVAKSMLQGIWVDDVTEMPFMRFRGDSIYYANQQNVPMAFKVVRDSIYFMGHDTLAYKIERQSDDDFWFRSFADDIVKLHRQSADSADTLAFSTGSISYQAEENQRIEKDSVVVYDGTRYRGYVFINPTSMKVTRTVYDENGIGVDNVFFDNVIHICVYEGTNLLWGRDISKDMFSGYLQDNVLSDLILADMNFTGVDALGYHYQAILQLPESLVSYLMNLDISFDGQLAITADDN